MEQQVRYVRSADGTNIAYADIGDGVPLIVSSNIWAHLDMTWQSEARLPLLALVRQGFRLIRYDMRGMGMSERDVHDFSIERQIDDLEAVRGRTRVDTFALFGVVHATPACIAYAATRPDRLTHLMLNIPFATGSEWYGALPTLRGLESFRELGDEQWALYTLTHATTLAGLSPNFSVEALAALMRAATTPTTLKRYFAALRTQDVSGLLGNVKTPTLVIETSRDDLVNRFAHAVVTAIPDATLARVDRALGAPTMDDVTLITRFVLAREPFSAVAVADPATPAGGMAVVLFADIANSTGLTEHIGDAAFRERARALDSSLRTIITEAAGVAIDGKLLGDGVLATFSSASQAITAALRCRGSADDAAMPLHLGIHAGDVIREDNNVYGGAVNIASRISALSVPGEILVSQTVRDLARTSAGVTFEDRGDQALKGIDDAVRVFAVHRASSTEPRT